MALDEPEGVSYEEITLGLTSARMPLTGLAGRVRYRGRTCFMEILSGRRQPASIADEKNKASRRQSGALSADKSEGTPVAALIPGFS